MNKDNFSHIEICTCKELGRTFTEVYLDGKKLRGVRSWNLSHDGTNSIPRLLLDLNAFGKEAWNNFILENEGKEVISEDLLNTIDAMRKTLYATPFAKKLIYGEHEKSFFWADEETGVECKCRPDSFGCIGNQPICVDLKTCQCAETDKFMRDAAKLGYDIQAAHYCDGLCDFELSSSNFDNWSPIIRIVTVSSVIAFVFSLVFFDIGVYIAKNRPTRTTMTQTTLHSII